MKTERSKLDMLKRIAPLASPAPFLMATNQHRLHITYPLMESKKSFEELFKEYSLASTLAINSKRISPNIHIR